MEKEDRRCKHCVHCYRNTTESMRWCSEILRLVYAESLPCGKFKGWEDYP